MSARVTYLCCHCCTGIAKDDHVGYGGTVEKDHHDGPCTLPSCREFNKPTLRAEGPTS